jgi:hypothetical protein
VNFFRNTIPTTDVTVPVGTIIATVAGLRTTSTAIQFRTVEEVTMYKALGSTYINTDTGKYEIQVQVEAVIPGNSGNVGANTITTLVSAVSGFDGAYNPLSTSGGTDEESSGDYAARLAEALAGNNVGTSAGYLQLISPQDGVDDTHVVGGGESLRDELGAIDVLFKGSTSAPYTDTYTPLNPSSPRDFVFTKQPVIYSSALVLIDSNLGVLTEGVDWEFVADTLEYAGTIHGQDTIHFLRTFTSPLGTITVKYQYNSLVTTLQSLLDSDQNQTENTSTLAKVATDIPIDVEVRVKVLAGYDSSVVQTEVVSSISSFLESSTIGSEVQQADIAREILNTPGVDDVTLPFTSLQSSDGSITRNADGNLTIPSNSYASTGTITVTII